MMGRPLEPPESYREYDKGRKEVRQLGEVSQQACLPFPPPHPHPGTCFTLDKAGPIEAPRTPNLMKSEPDTFLWSQGKVWRVGEQWGHAWRSARRKG